MPSPPGADPKAQAVVTGNTALDIASQKVGPDGMLATSGECLLLKKFTQRKNDRFHQVDMSPLAPYAAELEALKFMATVGLPVGLAKHSELMSHVESQSIDFANLVATLGVEKAVDSVFDTAAAAAGGTKCGPRTARCKPVFGQFRGNPRLDRLAAFVGRR